MGFIVSLIVWSTLGALLFLFVWTMTGSEAFGFITAGLTGLVGGCTSAHLTRRQK